VDADVAAKAVGVAMKPARSLRLKAERKLRFGLRVRPAVRGVVKDATGTAIVETVGVVMDAKDVSRSVSLWLLR